MIRKIVRINHIDGLYIATFGIEKDELSRYWKKIILKKEGFQDR